MTYFAPLAERVSGSVSRAGGWRRSVLAAIGLAVLAATVLAGFMAYMSPSMLLSLENLRLCF